MLFCNVEKDTGSVIFKGKKMNKLPLIVTKLTDKQARHRIIKPNQWYVSLFCISCGREFACWGKIESKHWHIKSLGRCLKCSNNKLAPNIDNVLNVAKKRALKILQEKTNAGGVL